MHYDIIFFHSPALYDFRKKPFFPGPIAETVSAFTAQFIMFPIGLLSIAEYLERNGYRVGIVNIAEFMLTDPNFNVENFIKKTDADVYGIDLHFCVHSQGSIEIARLCKRFHPNSLIVLGGLTATYFHDEIIKKYQFVDAILRGEGEKPTLLLLEKKDKLEVVPNLTFRDKNGKIVINSLSKPPENLDDFDFTRLNLVNPKALVTSVSGIKWWHIPICRGCVYNCVTCGGSSYTYKRIFGREKPAFRSPEKIVEDLIKLKQQGIEGVFLFQDSQMGGEKYWRSLFTTLRKEGIDIPLYIELFKPAGKNFIDELTRIGTAVAISISPESGVDAIRKAQGRNYSNVQLLSTLKYCKKRHIPVTVSFMIGLANETKCTLEKTLEFCEKLYTYGAVRDSDEASLLGSLSWLTPSIGPMILLDPGSLAFDYPDKYGYHLIFRCFEDYYSAMDTFPSWNQWISYETKYLQRESLVDLILYSLEKLIFIEQKFDKYDIPKRNTLRTLRLFNIKSDRFVIKELDRILKLQDPEERKIQMEALYYALFDLLNTATEEIEEFSARSFFGYYYQLYFLKLREILLKSVKIKGNVKI
jgi:B12-binding domain/radical SAM domain protein